MREKKNKKNKYKKDQEILKSAKKFQKRANKKRRKKVKSRVQLWKCELYMDNMDLVSTSQSPYFVIIYGPLWTSKGQDGPQRDMISNEVHMVSLQST